MKERKDYADECFHHYEREMDTIHADLRTLAQPNELLEQKEKKDDKAVEDRSDQYHSK